MNDALRPESDCILIARPGAVSDLNPVIIQSRYVLTDQTISFSRFCGVLVPWLTVLGSIFRNRQNSTE